MKVLTELLDFFLGLTELFLFVSWPLVNCLVQAWSELVQEAVLVPGALRLSLALGLLLTPSQGHPGVGRGPLI